MADELTWNAVHAWRMHASGLTDRVPRKRLLDVVSRSCGLHAQVMSSAELTAWARVDGLRPGDVADALWNRRALVKTWAMRGTLHLLPADELPLWVGALASADQWRKPSWFKAFDIAPDELEALIDAVAAALDGRELTRVDLGAEVARVSGDPALAEKLGESWGAYLKPVAFRGLLCFAPDQGRNVAFTRPDAWLGLERSPVGVEAALQEAARRWLLAFGPGTREHLARWWAFISPARAGKLLAALGDEGRAVEVKVEGTPLWAAAEHADALAGSAPAGNVALAPAFDQYVVGAPRKGPAAPFEPEHRELIYRKAGWLSPALLLDGRIAGVWSHERKGERLEVAIAPFEGVKVAKATRAAAESEAERLAQFLGGALVVSWS